MEVSKKQFLMEGSNLPSIGAFIEVLCFYGKVKEVEAFLNKLNSKGGVFYENHIENSVLMAKCFKLDFTEIERGKVF